MDAILDAPSLNVSDAIRSRKGVLFGPQLAAKRGEKSINATAKAMGVAPSTLMRLEKGEMGAGYDVSVKIAAFYKCTVEELRAAT